MRMRELTQEEAEEAAPEITRRQFILGAVALAINPSEVQVEISKPNGDALCLADLMHAIEVLESNSVSPMSDGNYFVYLPPRASEELKLDSALVGMSYRARDTAVSLLNHERRREDAGKRGHVSADEVLDRLTVIEAKLRTPTAIMESPVEIPRPNATRCKHKLLNCLRCGFAETDSVHTTYRGIGVIGRIRK